MGMLMKKCCRPKCKSETEMKLLVVGLDLAKRLIGSWYMAQ